MVFTTNMIPNRLSLSSTPLFDVFVSAIFVIVFNSQEAECTFFLDLMRTLVKRFFLIHMIKVNMKIFTGLFESVKGTGN